MARSGNFPGVYDFIEGALESKTPARAVINAGGVGYALDIPLSTYERLPASGRVRLLTVHQVGEDQVRLYGFATAAERSLFQILVRSVDKLGPAKALAVLSQVGVDRFARAVVDRDVELLRSLRGIGEKLAQRMVMELQDKLVGLAGPAGGGVAAGPVHAEAVVALQALGHSRSEAEAAVKKAAVKLGAKVTLEELIRAALA